MSVFVLSRLARNHLQTAYSLQCFFEVIPGVLGRSVNFSITKISIKTARVSRLYVSYDYGYIRLLLRLFT